MSRSTKFLIFVVNDMLDLSQMKQNALRKTITLFDIRNTINEIVTIQDYRASQMKIKVSTKYYGFGNRLLPLGTSSKFMVCTDEQRMQQILMNLLSNALKFTPRKGKIKISCSYLPPERHSLIRDDFGSI